MLDLIVSLKNRNAEPDGKRKKVLHDNEFLSKMDTEELVKLRGKMIHALLRRRKFEDVRLLGEYCVLL